MNEIKCPHCKTVFQIDEQSYNSIAKQVRDEEFRKDLQEREKQFNSEKDTALEIQEANLERKYEKVSQTLKDEYTKKLNDQQVKINELTSKLENINNDHANAIKLQETKYQLELQEEKSKNIQELEKVTTKLETSKSEYLIKETSLKATYEEKLKAKDEQIAYYKDFKARQSTKMVGESLEVHCNTEFNKLRPLFKNAYFEKDNDAKTGSKGDFIFKDYDDEGTEITSIMFEMKNEADMTASKHKNEDFFKELDKDRHEKNCEYAVLVSLLEIDNDYYNTGIVDVSYRYPKMYVIRPQFFIPLITLIRSMGLNTLDYKKELEIVQNQNIDISNFEDSLNKFKNDFGRNYALASKKFTTAIEEIDKTIDHLQKTKEALLSSDKNLRIANDKIDNITIKKLTNNSKSIRDMFTKLKEEKVISKKGDSAKEETDDNKLLSEDLND
ncbi:pF09903 family protein [Mycoplasma sp. CAG:956]|nr:pF09903 family protein [Mycoplasma sp. CAG:956]